MDRILGGEQGVRVPVPDLGEVIAAGQLADIITSAASTTSAGDGVKISLMEFSVPETAAETYRDGIKAGGILFFIRTEDGRAPEAAGVLRKHKGRQVANFPR